LFFSGLGKPTKSIFSSSFERNQTPVLQPIELSSIAVGEGRQSKYLEVTVVLWLVAALLMLMLVLLVA
jgi:hypothetical protein